MSRTASAWAATAVLVGLMLLGCGLDWMAELWGNFRD